MRHALASLGLSLSLVGCYDVGTGSTGTRTCEQLGWVCGTDGFGAACGSCAAPQTCSFGSCVDPGAQVIASGATAYALAGGYAGTLFALPASALVRYTASSAGFFQLGIFTVSDWTLFASGQPSGAFILSNATPLISDGVQLPAGTYTLGFRCANAVDACTIRYSVNATY